MKINVNKSNLKDVTTYLTNINNLNYIREEKPSFKQIKINDIINNFNNSSKINPININSEIKIKFTSFTFFSKFLNNIKDIINNFLNKDYNKALAQYETKTNEITINEEFFNDGLNINSSGLINDLYKNNINPQDISNLVILHEIGHAVFHLSHNKIKTQLNNEGEFIKNFIDLNYEYFSYNSKQDLVSHMQLSVLEGFADLYSVICLDILYQDKNKTKPIIQELINARKNHDYDHYNSYQSLEKYLKERDNLQLNDFDSINNYIISTITKTSYELFEDKINNLNADGIKQLEEFCGFIKNNDKDLIKCSSARMVLLKLNEKYSLQIEAKIKNIYFNDHDEHFDNGVQKSKNKNSIYSKIKFVRLKYTNDCKTFSIKPKF